MQAQVQYELNKGWYCAKANGVPKDGKVLSKSTYPLTKWMPATVPGTVLTQLLLNKKIPDPFYGMNNKLIPDIYDSGSAYYTYWYAVDFREVPRAGSRVWLQLRGINYKAVVYVNGMLVNSDTAVGMYLRHKYDITKYLAKDGKNRLAVKVFPPDHVGNPNGGQGGDGVIAKNVTNQYVAGWDWIQPIHDRNTGIWDKVIVEKTGNVDVYDVHVVTQVPGKRSNNDTQQPATITVSACAYNAGNKPVTGKIVYEIDGQHIEEKLKIASGERVQKTLPVCTLKNPKLWWPNGYGKQELYELTVQFVADSAGLQDEERVRLGIREISTAWNMQTQSRELYVNGARILVKGANWIASDAMMRSTNERYDAEVRYHKEMNLNMIRVWGGGLTERPEFYDACDRYGLLVMQDFWITADCNGRWHDTYKKDDTTARRLYPTDHKLWLATAADQVAMLRNHASLAIWCGGNEIRPPADILKVLRDSILPVMDGTRYFYEYSNHDSMSLKAHDGPYTIQKDRFFWEHRSYALNSEVGSVGVGDVVSLERFIPKENMVVPYYDTVRRKWVGDSVWEYHKYSSYDSAVMAYGAPKDVADFCRKAQLVNYNQYRALMEGVVSKMWEWYTGVLVWKTQNPWTAMVGQMYDVYLDPNAGLYGQQAGAQPIHVLYRHYGKRCVLIANTSGEEVNDAWVRCTVYDVAGSVKLSFENRLSLLMKDKCIEYKCFNDEELKAAGIGEKGCFMSLQIVDDTKTKVLDDNLYWLPDKNESYAWLNELKPVKVHVTAKSNTDGQISVTIANNSKDVIAFFNRVFLVDKITHKRILPLHSSTNYVSVMPMSSKELRVKCENVTDVQICIEGWNIGTEYIEIQK